MPKVQFALVNNNNNNKLAAVKYITDALQQSLKYITGTLLVHATAT